MATGAKERIAAPVLGRQIVFGLFLVVAVLAAVSVIIFTPNVLGGSIERPNVSQASTDAYAARWVAMGEFYTTQAEARQWALNADAARYTGLAEYFGVSTGSSQRALDAYTARYVAMGEFYTTQAEASRQRALDADAARYNGLAEYFGESTGSSQRALNADADRLTALAEHFGKPTGSSQRALDAETARLTALAEYYSDK